MMKSMIQTVLVVMCFLALGTDAFAPNVKPSVAYSQMDTRHYNYFDNLGSMYRNWGRKVTASHICIGPKKMDEDEAKAFLTDLKGKINNDPAKFAEAAVEHSGCPSKKKGGDLGEFGPGAMVKNFDLVCFETGEVGVVEGPVSTQFGEHLILITSRTEKK